MVPARGKVLSVAALLLLCLSLLSLSAATPNGEVDDIDDQADLLLPLSQNSLGNNDTLATEGDTPEWMTSDSMGVGIEWSQRPPFWTHPKELMERINSLQPFEPTEELFWPNITGVYRGRWNLSVTHAEWMNKSLNDSASLPLDLEGSIVLNIVTEKTAGYRKINLISGNMRIHDGPHSRRFLSGIVVGLHFQAHGTALLLGAIKGTTIPLLKRLPLLVENESYFEDVVAVVNKKIEELLKEGAKKPKPPKSRYEQTKERDRERRLLLRDMDFLSKCSLTFVWKFDPVPSEYSRRDVSQFENELNNPQGIPLLSQNVLVPHGILYSKECGFMAETVIQGIRPEIYFHKSVNYAFLLGLFSMVEILLFLRQMKHTTSEASLAKVSFVTIGHLAILDSYICLLHLTTGIVVDSVSNMFTLVGFFKFVHFSFLELRYMLLAWKAQTPDLIRNGWERARREISALYARFYGILLFGIVIFYNAHGTLAYIFAFLMYSFWLPQIFHNIKNDCRKPLDRTFVLGSSITRLYLPLYVLACPKNVMGFEPNGLVALVLVLYVAVQVTILLIQDSFGPRFFLPKEFTPPRYDYRTPILANKWDTETGAPPTLDCVICREAIEESQPHMITPCSHIFHEDCLQSWMRFKMECPTCRAELPEP